MEPLGIVISMERIEECGAVVKCSGGVSMKDFCRKVGGAFPCSAQGLSKLGWALVRTWPWVSLGAKSCPYAYGSAHEVRPHLCHYQTGAHSAPAQARVSAQGILALLREVRRNNEKNQHVMRSTSYATLEHVFEYHSYAF